METDVRIGGLVFSSNYFFKEGDFRFVTYLSCRRRTQVHLLSCRNRCVSKCSAHQK